MGNLFHTFLTQPLFNALVLLYEHVTLADMGLAVILLTVIVRLLLWPVFHKSVKSQSMMQKLHPQIKEIQKKHKDNKEKQAELLLKLYKDNNVNPFGGFALLLVQLPIIFALYRVFLNGFSDEMLANNLYGFVPAIDHINNVFLTIMNLDERNIPLAFIAAAIQYVHSKMAIARTPQPSEGDAGALNPMVAMGRKMVYIMPVFTLVFLWHFPSVIGLYWVTSTVFGIAQQAVVNKKIYGKQEKSQEEAG